jgi:hypothetical protein
MLLSVAALHPLLIVVVLAVRLSFYSREYQTPGNTIFASESLVSVLTVFACEIAISTPCMHTLTFGVHLPCDVFRL